MAQDDHKDAMAASGTKAATDNGDGLETLVIHEDGSGKYQWSLQIRQRERHDGGTELIVEAVRVIPYDGSLRFSTADYPNNPRKRSQHKLDIETVIERYTNNCKSTPPEKRLLNLVYVAYMTQTLSEYVA